MESHRSDLDRMGPAAVQLQEWEEATMQPAEGGVPKNEKGKGSKHRENYAHMVE